MDVPEKTGLNIVDNEITYRQIQIQNSRDNVSGFALVYKDIDRAIQGVGYFNDYFEIKGGSLRFIIIECNKQSSDTYNLELRIKLPELLYSINIDNILSEHIFQLSKQLEEYSFFFIMIGYKTRTGVCKIFPPDFFSYYRSVIRIDGVEYRGSGVKKWPREIFRNRKLSNLIKV